MEREQLEVDILFVGAGPATLTAAIATKYELRASGREVSMLVIEKGSSLGAHSLSGAVFDPRALLELEALQRRCNAEPWTIQPPFDAQVQQDMLWMLHSQGKIRAPYIPPALTNTGKHMLSIQRFVAWLGTQAEALGIDCFPAFPATELLWDAQRVVGVRIGDKGVGKHGQPLENFEPGCEIRAKITVLGEGVRGTLTKTAIARLDLAKEREPQVYALGIKELWKLPKGTFPTGTVVHTLGYPLPSETFGGGWLYGLENDILDIGFVVGLDSPDPSTDAHDTFNRFKLHPAIRPLLDNGEMLSYGAKAIPEGGLYALPRLYADGLLILGDSAGFLNGLRLKGIHLAMKSGLLASEAILHALMLDRYDSEALAIYEQRFRQSWAYTELYQARNVHQGFAWGMVPGLLNAALGMVNQGRGFGVVERLPGQSGLERLLLTSRRMPRALQKRIEPDQRITFDKLADVYRSGTRHDEHQPSHLRVADTSICADRCTSEYGNPCQYFCPAKVYHPEFKDHNGKIEGQLRIDFANCVHCKTCDIIDPYQIITWVPPQGGDGPVYTNM